MRSPRLDMLAGTIRRDESRFGKLRLGRLVVAAFSLAVIGVLMSLMSPADLAAQLPPGREVTISGPLPLPVSGTVGISGTPSVVVSNAPSQPVPVRNLSEPA